MHSRTLVLVHKLIHFGRHYNLDSRIKMFNMCGIGQNSIFSVCGVEMLTGILIVHN